LHQGFPYYLGKEDKAVNLIRGLVGFVVLGICLDIVKKSGQFGK
jgi:hypothetical protein